MTARESELETESRTRRKVRRSLDRLRRSRYGLWLIGVMSFLETIIVPIPIELVLIPYMAGARDRIWRIATVTLTACLLAALLGYGVGLLLYESVGRWFLEQFGQQGAYASYQSFFDEYGFLAVLAVGLIPIPFQVAMITAGLAGYPLWKFILASLIARGARYFGLAWLVLRFGEDAKRLWEKHAVLASFGAAAILVGIAVLTRMLAGIML